MDLLSFLILLSLLYSILVPHPALSHQRVESWLVSFEYSYDLNCIILSDLAQTPCTHPLVDWTEQFPVSTALFKFLPTHPVLPTEYPLALWGFFFSQVHQIPHCSPLLPPAQMLGPCRAW